MAERRTGRSGAVRAAPALLVLFCCASPGCRREAEGPPAGELGGVTGNWEPREKLPASPEILALGKATYARKCAACHGPEGKGDGEAAYLLYPKPRNFADARYRLVSTWERVPADEDLFRTISRGMPGSAMPSWAHLPERTRWGLVHHLKSLAAEPWTVGSPGAGDPRKGVVQVPRAPPFTEEARAAAVERFQSACAPCHGPEGKGDGVQKQVDDEGYPTRPRDLTAGVFKGLPDAEHVYRRTVLGLPGSPMPLAQQLEGDAAWGLTHYVLSLSTEEQRERVEMKRFAIPAPRASRVPSHPDDGLWRQAPCVNLHLMPLWWRARRPEELMVKAMHDGEDLAILLTWADETHDHTAIRPQDFRDAAAIEFSLTSDPPFFAMGERGSFVNLWMWKSERQADVEVAFQELDKIYPNLGIDSYPNLQLSPLEQPMRRALTLESDPSFVTAWGAGNIVADPTRKVPSEDLVAQGFGTLSARPPIDQQVQADGVYSTGTYRVVFRRSLRGRGERAADLKPGTTVPVAFAVWNGSAGDRDGKKSVTIWQDLQLAP